MVVSRKSANTKSRYSKRPIAAERTATGSGVVEAASGLVLIVPAVVLGVLLLINVYFLTYYQGKLGLVTNSAAAYAASILSIHNSFEPTLTPDILSAQTEVRVKQVLSQMGLPAQNVSVTATPGRNLVRVTVRVDGLPLAGEGNIFPLTVSLQDSSVAALNNDEPPMLVKAGNSLASVVPCYGRFALKNSTGKQPPKPGFCNISPIVKSHPGVQVPLHFGFDPAVFTGPAAVPAK